MKIDYNKANQLIDNVAKMSHSFGGKFSKKNNITFLRGIEADDRLKNFQVDFMPSQSFEYKGTTLKGEIFKEGCLIEELTLRVLKKFKVNSIDELSIPEGSLVLFFYVPYMGIDDFPVLRNVLKDTGSKISWASLYIDETAISVIKQ